MPSLGIPVSSPEPPGRWRVHFYVAMTVLLFFLNGIFSAILAVKTNRIDQADAALATAQKEYHDAQSELDKLRSPPPSLP